MSRDRWSKRNAKGISDMQAIDLSHEDIEAYLARHQKKELLRFLTCGSVDDGKSTLIGRLLHDTKTIYEDQLAAVTRDSEKVGTTGAGEIDLALLTDGLKAEREQGITIDVAYRYFSTDHSDRRPLRGDDSDSSAFVHRIAVGDSTRYCGDQQDGPGRIFAGRF